MVGKITIADVAERADVARSTVSHVISGKRPISEEVKNRVFSAISELGYKPSLAARSMKGERTKMVGALVDGLSNPISGLMMQALFYEFNRLGYGLSVCICGDSHESGLASLNRVSSGFFDGILNALPEISAIEAICACQPVPVITYLRPYAEAPLLIDYGKSVNAALDYLLNCGHRRIGMIVDMKNKSKDNPDDEPKFGAFKAYMNAKGLFDPALCRYGQSRTDDGISYAPQLHALGCTAILAGNDQIAAGVLLWARERKIDVPRELSVIGYDDSPVAMLANPPLTTIQLPLTEIAVPTAKRLVEKIEGSASHQQQLVIVPRLIVRGSSGPATINNHATAGRLS